MFGNGRLLESELNGMAVFILCDDECAQPVTLLDKAETAYDEWMAEVDGVGDTAICDWLEEQLEQNGFNYGKDYRIFTDLYWD